MIINPYRFGAGGGTDPYWANVVAALHMDGVDASTTFTDETGRAWTAHGTTQIDTAAFKFGGASGLFGSGCIKTASTSDFNFGTGNFAIDWWLRFPPSASARGYVYSNDTNSAAIIVTQITGLVEIYGPGSWVINSGAVTFTQSQWYHMALERVGNAWTVYRDGAVYATATDSRSWGSSSNSTRIGNYQDSGGGPLICHIDDFRVTKGVARFNGPFTPPTAPFPNS